MRVTKEFEQGRAFAFSLWVTVERGARSHVFELDGQRSRAVVIGSTRDATQSVYEPELAPVECFLEREGDEIWLVPGTPSSPLRVDGVRVDRPIRLWRRCTVEVAHYCYVVRVREEPPTARDLEIPVRRADHVAEKLHASGTLCGGFDVTSLGLREPGVDQGCQPSQELPPGVDQWQPDRAQAIPVCEIVAVGSIERDSEPQLPLGCTENSGLGPLTQSASHTNVRTQAAARQLSVRSTDVGLSPSANRSESLLTGAQPDSVPFRPTFTPHNSFVVHEPSGAGRASLATPTLPIEAGRVAPSASYRAMGPELSAPRGARHSDASAARGASRSASAPRYRINERRYDVSDASPSSAPPSSVPLSSAPLSSGPPSSASAAVISVRDHSTTAVHQLERLGLLTRRRPLVVTLGVVLGAATIAFSMKLGTEAVLALQRSSDLNRVSLRAHELAHTGTFCRSGSQKPVQLEREACRWLGLTWTVPSLLGSPAPINPTSEAIHLPAGRSEPSSTPVRGGVGASSDGIEPTITPTTRSTP